ncbi:FAD-binding oxidoreductase [Janibacter sp. G56]|uniref:FAD-binding oxidoreductase n=1 Tax=Janibacter sp. G56 TaxID=3418717 RepID=UPI003D0114EA
MSLLVPSTGTRRPTFHSLEVVDVERLTDAAVAITFAVPDDLAGQYLRFEAGQHVTLRADLGHGEVRQSYSIAMSPTRARETATLRVGSAHVPGGRMSTWLNTVVAVGDRIDVMTPTGGFHSPRCGPASPDGTWPSPPARGSPPCSRSSRTFSSASRSPP